MHSAAGERLGITKDEIEKLVRLEESDFEYREWLALKFARDFVVAGGKEPAGEFFDDFKEQYSAKERGYILKLARMQYFMTRFMHAVKRQPWRDEKEYNFDKKDMIT